MDEHDRNISMLIQSLQPTPIEKPVLYFSAPWHRGQRITFSLKNTFPEDHIILFKFMTSTAAANNTIMNKSNRYFVRPSAGKMVSSSATDQMNIMLFLNQVPEGFTDSGRGVEGLKTVTKLKDKIIIRWAAIQRNTRIEAWVNSLQESTRRKWIDMLDEEWPDQVTIHMTRIKVRFNT
ncbi:hypothetical protein BDF20DRAFT_812444 [Mycotypha africana]|uniref:uncharacterized protein n=1 Tax=Mycotypha africana TaxID=64632 RepID=UPI002301050A|nr:uncharacterized protein BDF20DRAFT_812444 [Mycotypha africana]KAI8990836.1 hypothetical protein BDF20DRAFT_812444 [Mycotypha africana]